MSLLILFQMAVSSSIDEGEPEPQPGEDNGLNINAEVDWLSSEDFGIHGQYSVSLLAGDTYPGCNPNLPNRLMMSLDSPMDLLSDDDKVSEEKWVIFF